MERPSSLLRSPFLDIINEGIEKLNAYHHCTELILAYTISMSMLPMLAIMISQLHSKYLVLNPSMKLQHIPLEKHGEANRVLCCVVSEGHKTKDIMYSWHFYLIAPSLL